MRFAAVAFVVFAVLLSIFTIVGWTGTPAGAVAIIVATFVGLRAERLRQPERRS